MVGNSSSRRGVRAPPMRYLVEGVLIGAIVGAAAGFAGGLVAFPRLFGAGASGEGALERGADEVRATGAFSHVVPSDPTHYGAGRVIVYDDLVHLDADFEVGPGPKYHLYLVPQVGIDAYTRVEETMFVDLGPIPAFAGSQSFPIPRGVDVADYPSVVVWCEQFNRLISPAELSFAR